MLTKLLSMLLTCKKQYPTSKPDGTIILLSAELASLDPILKYTSFRSLLVLFTLCTGQWMVHGVKYRGPIIPFVLGIVFQNLQE